MVGHHNNGPQINHISCIQTPAKRVGGASVLKDISSGDLR